MRIGVAGNAIPGLLLLCMESCAETKLVTVLSKVAGVPTFQREAET